MKIRKRFASMAAAALLSVGLVAVTAQPVEAYAGCGSDRMCFWTGYSGTGSIFTISSTTLLSLGCQTFTSGGYMNNNSQSWQNNLSFSVDLHDANGCPFSGWWRTLAPGQVATGQGSDWNDRISSFF
jgi:hypothetical protein